MVFTRSSKVHTRGSSKKDVKDVDNRPRAKVAPTPCERRIKKTITTSFTPRVTRTSQKRSNPSDDVSVMACDNEVSGIETKKADISVLHSFVLRHKNFLKSHDYEESLFERTQGNPVLSNVAKDMDKEIALFRMCDDDKISSDEAEKRRRDAVKTEIFKSFETLTSDDMYLQYLNMDRKLSSMRITRSPIIKKVRAEYTDLKKEVKKNTQCQAKRLRPRSEKINYSILNGTKRFGKLFLRNEKSDDAYRSGSNLSNAEVKDGSKKEKRNNFNPKSSADTAGKRLCQCGKCDNCLEDDAETDGCEMSDFGVSTMESVTVENKEDDKNTPLQTPIERRRRNCSNKMINWKYCYAEDHDTKKGTKRKKCQEDLSNIPVKKSRSVSENKIAAKLGNGKTDAETYSSVKHENKELKKQSKADSKDHKTIHVRCDRGFKTSHKMEINGQQDDDQGECSKKRVDKPTNMKEEEEEEEEEEEDMTSGTKDLCNSSPSCSRNRVDEDRNDSDFVKSEKGGVPESVSQNCIDSGPSNSSAVLKEYIKDYVSDELKVKISENPLTAELTEINYEQFYRLVVVLQGTNFIVKNAAMQNIRGPNEKISQLYNCTVCHKDQIEDQQSNFESSKLDGPSSSSKTSSKEQSKYGRPDGTKLPQIRPKIPSRPESVKEEPASPQPPYDVTKMMNLAKLQRRNRAKIAPKTQPHIVPRAPPQLAPKPYKVVGVPQYEMPTSKVPPIIFPSHVSSSTSSITTTNNASSSPSMECDQTNKDLTSTSGRVLVKATCFQRRPKLEPLDPGSDDSDNLALDPDLKDRIISDITQTGKSIPDSRGLREALKRMGRRKTDPDIHPITRRMNKKVVRKMYTGNESLPNILKRPVGPILPNSVNSGSPGRPCTSSSVMSGSSGTTQSSNSRPASYENRVSFANRSELRNYGSPQKVQLDNRGRYVDPYKPVERREETPATALTASERLKLQKIDVAKSNSTVSTSVSTRPKIVNPPHNTTDNIPKVSKSASPPVPSPAVLVRPTATKKQGESGDESDFELGEAPQPFKVAMTTCSVASNSNVISGIISPTSTNIKVGSQSTATSGPVHIKILPKPDGAVRSVNLSGKPLFHDKTGFRKILPRPNPATSSQSASSSSSSQVASVKIPRSQEVPVVTVSNIDSQDICNIQRRPMSEQDEQPAVSPIRQQDREMFLLKSILRQKSPATANDISPQRLEHGSNNPGMQSVSHSNRNPSSTQAQANRISATIDRSSVSSINSAVVCNTAGSLRVPPASSYTSVTPLGSQASRTPTAMKPITIRMTRLKNQGTFGAEASGSVIVGVHSKANCEKS